MASSNPFLTRQRVVLVKTEATEGTDAAPVVGDDFLLCEEASIGFEVGIVERPALKPYWSPLASVTGGYSVTWSITFELKGGGAADADSPAIPDYDPVLRACGMKRVIENVPNPISYKYQPATTVQLVDAAASQIAPASMTMWLYEGGTSDQSGGLNGRLWKLRGCHGNLTGTVTAGERFMLTAEGVGFLTTAGALDTNPLDAEFPTTVTLQDVAPPVGLSLGFDVDGFDYKASTFSFDLGNDVQLRPCLNRVDGYLGAVITGRNPTGSTDPELESIDEVAAGEYFNYMMAATEGALDMTLTSEAGGVGYRVDVDAPKCQIVSYGRGDRNGVMTADLGLAFREDGGDDELVIKVY